MKNFIRNKSLGFKVGAVLALFHFGLIAATYISIFGSRSSTAGLAFLWTFFLDAPLLFLPESLFTIFGENTAFIKFGILGSLLWFLVPWLADKVMSPLYAKTSWGLRLTLLLVVVLLTGFGFSRLSAIGIQHSMRQDRPAELKKEIGKSNTDFLSENVVTELGARERISGIFWAPCGTGKKEQLFLTIPRGLVFLNKDYQEAGRVNLTSLGFWTIDPIVGKKSEPCHFLTYKLNKSAHLFDHKGKELWNFAKQDKTTGGIDGAKFGDIDGDGSPEFIVHYRYRTGFNLLDSDGQEMWRHPVYSLKHLEIVDMDLDGTNDILLYGNFGKQENFAIVGADGATKKEWKLDTQSSKFSIIRWPTKTDLPYLLLTEENQIRIVRPNGDIIKTLEAPGCRPFGDMKAVPVKFAKNEPPYLAVRKSLHPDLLVLYVYNSSGELVYQKTDKARGSRYPIIEAIPGTEPGTEKLLVAKTAEDWKKHFVMEYTLGNKVKNIENTAP